MLSMRSLHSATVLYSNSYYTVVASIFLVSAASCKAICGVASVRTSDYSQPFWLKRHTLLMPHVLIKYAHVLICISAGEGSRHFSAFIYFISIFWGITPRPSTFITLYKICCTIHHVCTSKAVPYTITYTIFLLLQAPIYSTGHRQRQNEARLLLLKTRLLLKCKRGRGL